MPKRHSSLYCKAIELTKPDENPIDLAECLWQLRQQEPDSFDALAGGKGMSRRKALYLVNIWETFADLDVPKWLLADVGWTKLVIVAKYCDPDMVGSGLDLAQRNTARNLASILMGGEQMVERRRSVLLYFTPRQYRVYAKAVLMHGAKKSKNGKGLAGQEEAVVAIARKAVAST
jgi:hypothetical protein